MTIRITALAPTIAAVIEKKKPPLASLKEFQRSLTRAIELDLKRLCEIHKKGKVKLPVGALRTYVADESEYSGEYVGVSLGLRGLNLVPEAEAILSRLIYSLPGRPVLQHADEHPFTRQDAKGPREYYKAFRTDDGFTIYRKAS